jgi:hypothetical protein
MNLQRIGGHTKRRHRHAYGFVLTPEGRQYDPCACGKVRDEALIRRNRNNGKRGRAYELTAAKKYGGEKVGPLGLPEDIRGALWRTQVKTHLGSVPGRWSVTEEWREVFAKLGTYHDGHRYPRLLLIFRPGGKTQDFFVVPRRVANDLWGDSFSIRWGWLVDDYFVVRGSDWLEWFGKDD